jgi:2-polyprenyl-3-methyl-5-hydroxy-6-metoxy-1,4-benzoquinol methylase
MNCPICDNKTHRLFQKHEYWIRECDVCQHRYAEITATVEHVDQVYGDHYFQEGGDGYPDYLKEKDILIRRGKQYGKLLGQYMQPGKVLDIGAAAGFILKGLQETGWQGTGIEPNPAMSEYARTQLGLDVNVGTLEQLQGDVQYDLISMIQVVPHFYDIQAAFKVAATITRPGGFWLIETWNRKSWLARIFGQNWHEYSPPSVLHFFSPDTLVKLVKQFGFEEVARGRPAKKLNSSHAKSLLQYKLQNSALGKPATKLVDLVPDGVAIPYPSFDLFWVLYQKTESF